MTDKTMQTPNSATAIAALRHHLLEKGHCFERGPRYEGQARALMDVAQTVRMYEGMGYHKLMQWGNPPVYAVLGRGHREMHIFQPQDPKIRTWLEDPKTALNDPTMRQYLLETSGLKESDLTTASKPQCFHITEIDDIFILTGEDVH